MEISLGLAFFAGMASFLTPCVFSLVPAYISYLSGRSLADLSASVKQNRLETLAHGFAFVLGFSIVFILLGVTVSFIGSLMYGLRDWLAKIGGIIVVFFGLHMTGILRIPFLDYDLRPQSQGDRQRSYLSSMLLGVFFSAGWSPCVGPVLGSILTLALNGGSLSTGVKLLSIYSLGLAIPFLAAALGVGWVSTLLRKYRKIMHTVEIVMGIVLIIVGVMLFLGTFELLARFGPFVDFGL
jgi:cytochrome c-type biogenesis protein